MVGRVAAFLSLRLRLIMQTSTMTANTIVPRRVAPMIIPSIASLERPLEELELVEELEPTSANFLSTLHYHYSRNTFSVNIDRHADA